MRKTTFCVTALCLAALPAMAQTSRFAGYLGGGFTEPMRDIGKRLDRGWNFGAGAGVNVTNHFGLMVDFTFNDMNINRTALNQIGAPDGSTRIWGLTLNPRVSLTSEEAPVDLYITGGGGIYRRTVEFTEPGVSTVTVFDPWWGIFYPANVPTSFVIGSHSVMKPGVNGGAGVAFRLGQSRAKLFAEARYHHMFTNGIDTNFIPVTFGIRF